MDWNTTFHKAWRFTTIVWYLDSDCHEIVLCSDFSSSRKGLLLLRLFLGRRRHINCMTLAQPTQTQTQLMIGSKSQKNLDWPGLANACEAFRKVSACEMNVLGYLTVVTCLVSFLFTESHSCLTFLIKPDVAEAPRTRKMAVRASKTLEETARTMPLQMTLPSQQPSHMRSRIRFHLWNCQFLQMKDVS